MLSFSDVIKGILIGAACVLPGISGGALALSLGIYETILKAVSRLFSNPKQSLRILFPFVLGGLITLVFFTYAAEYLISHHPFPFAMTTGGFLIGGAPALWQSLKNCPHSLKQRKSGLALFFLFFLLTLLFSAIQPPLVTGKPLSPHISTALITFCLGLLYSITMVIPGVSGSLLLMMFGYYYSLIETAKELLENLRALQFSVSLPLAFILLPFFLGLALGGYVLSSCVTWFFTEHRFSTYCAVLGIIVSSLFTIFHHMGIFALLPTLSIQESLCGILLFVGGMLLTNQLSQTGTA